MRLDATAGVIPYIPFCIPNIDFPAIASIFSQSQSSQLVEILLSENISENE